MSLKLKVQLKYYDSSEGLMSLDSVFSSQSKISVLNCSHLHFLYHVM